MSNQLLPLLKENDARAQHEFYEQYKRKWMKFCLLRLHGREWAEEAMQDGFREFFAAAAKKFRYRSDSETESYLRLLFTQCCEKKRRYMNRYSFIIHEEMDLPEIPDEAIDEAFNQLQVEEIITAIDRLPGSQQGIFTMRAMQVPLKNIAAEFGITENNAGKIYRSAKRQIVLYIQHIKNTENG